MRIPLVPLLMVTLLGAAPCGAQTEFWRMPQLGGFPLHDVVPGQIIVIPFTDDNGDGRITTADGGDVLVVGGQRAGQDNSGDIRLLDGRTGQDLWGFDPPMLSSELDPVTSLAAGDIDGDGFPEVIAAIDYFARTNLVAYNYDGSVRWISPLQVTYAGAFRSINFADLDGDGQSEILASNTVLNNQGEVIQQLQIPACLEAYAIDVDLDGVLDIACGTAAAHQDGTAIFVGTRLSTVMGPCQLDDDPEPEFCGTGASAGPTLAIDNDGTELWSSEPVGFGSPSNISFPLSDADGNGYSDIFTALLALSSNEGFMRCLDEYGSERWLVPSDDDGVTGGILANISGPLTYLHSDINEVVVLNPVDGARVFGIPNFTEGYWVAPVFADLDGDGQGELLTQSDRDPTIGVRAWKDPSWCPARAIWSQHAFVPEVIGDDLRPAGPSTWPRDWLTVGWRKQRNDCACVSAPVASIVVRDGCADGTVCVEADITGGTAPFHHDWTLPDGSVSSEPVTCFPVAADGVVSLSVRDSGNCSVGVDAPVSPPPPHEIVVTVSPDCLNTIIQCAEVIVTPATPPFTHAWTLPDGSASSAENPCFRVDAAGSVSVTVTDAQGCTFDASAPVLPYVDPVLVELSAPSSGAPLLVSKVPPAIHVTWQGSPAGAPMALWAGLIGDWSSHAAIGCTALPEGDDLSSEPLRYYLAGETGCGGLSGPLGADSTGSTRNAPGSGCP